MNKEQNAVWNASPALTNYVSLICQAIVINSPAPQRLTATIYKSGKNKGEE